MGLTLCILYYTSVVYLSCAKIFIRAGTYFVNVYFCLFLLPGVGTKHV
jgi:hypothetical protein